MVMTLKPKPDYPNGKHFAIIEEIKEKSKQKLLAIPQKARFRSASRIEKNAGISVLYLREVTLKGHDIIIYFSYLI